MLNFPRGRKQHAQKDNSYVARSLGGSSPSHHLLALATVRMLPLNLFYSEPESDRWIPFDRYPRRFVRRVVRGKARPGGQKIVFLNLCAGLDRLGVAYRVNDFPRAARHPGEVACIIGKPHLLDIAEWENPILFGAAVFSHPSEDPDLLTRLPVRRILVPGEWMRRMCEPAWGDMVKVWPVGIDTRTWEPAPPDDKDIDVLLYDKVLWNREERESGLIEPITSELQRRGLHFVTLRYGSYRDEDFRWLLSRSRMMIFLCEHETQGIAYQQALSCNVPILAWDHGGYWQDPSFYPHKVRFSPVSSVPYWDERCGVKFFSADDFPGKLEEFLERQRRAEFSPRDYILENLTLEKCARAYLSFYNEIR